MLCTARYPSLQRTRPSAPIAPRWSRPSGCKNAHRGLAAFRRPASAPTRSQAPSASRKNVRCVRTARRTPLLSQGNQPTSEVTVTAQRPNPYSLLTCAKGGFGCDPSIQPTKPCIVAFLFSGREADAAWGGGFAGTISEYNLFTGQVDFGALGEAWAGGEAGVLGAAASHSFRTGENGFFTFAGTGLSAGPLAGGQGGLYLESNGIGVYAEGHSGPVAGGAGLGIAPCQ